jgi:hypothetical protein
MRNTLNVNSYGEATHKGDDYMSLNKMERTEHVREANITSAQMRKTMKVGASPKSRGTLGASPLNASSGNRRSTHKSPNNKY